MSQFPALSFQKFRFWLEIRSPTMLPSYKGSTFQGGMRSAFKKLVCLMSEHGYTRDRKNEECTSCPITNHCCYYALFRKRPSVRGYNGQVRNDVPMSYIIEPPLTERRMFDTGDRLDFSIVLIGASTSYWNLLTHAVKQLGQTHGIGRRLDGRRGRFLLRCVDSIGLNGNESTVFSTENGLEHSQPITLKEEDVIQPQGATQHNEHILIRFLTPVCFIENVKKGKKKRLVTELDSALLLRQLVRRLDLLSQAYCKGTCTAYSLLLERISDIRTSGSDLVRTDFDRYSRRQRMRHPVSGVIGSLRLAGDLEPFLPYLRLGEWLHLGKKTTFGLGQYRIEETRNEP